MHFQFKQFDIRQDRCRMKVGTDSILLGSWATAPADGRILDIGAGSGVLSLMLAQRTENVHITGVEIDLESAGQAAENAAASQWSERVTIAVDSIQNYARTQDAGAFQLILSNPPFFTGGNLSENQQRNSVRHTVKLSHHDLLRAVQKLLHPEGRFAVILPHIEGLRLVEIAKSYHLHLVRIQRVRPHPQRAIERVLLEFQLEEGGLQEEPELVLHTEVGSIEPSPAFRELAQAFYLHW